MKIFQFITFHIKFQQVQKRWALGLMKQMDLLYKIKRFVLFDYGLLDKTCDKGKYIVSKKCGIASS